VLATKVTARIGLERGNQRLTVKNSGNSRRRKVE
jgi:hypothetical protein